MLLGLQGSSIFVDQMFERLGLIFSGVSLAPFWGGLNRNVKEQPSKHHDGGVSLWRTLVDVASTGSQKETGAKFRA